MLKDFETLGSTDLSSRLLPFFQLSITILFVILSATFQSPRALSQADLEKVLTTSRKTKVAASEYSGLTSSQSSGWSRSGDPGDYPVQAAINELSKLVVSHVLNLQPDSQDQ